MMTRTNFPQQMKPGLKRPKKGKKAGRGFAGVPPARAKRQP